jgi:hypothetical protein
VPLSRGSRRSSSTATSAGRWLAFDNSRTVRELGIEYRPAGESVVEHFQQMIDDGLVKG